MVLLGKRLIGEREEDLKPALRGGRGEMAWAGITETDWLMARTGAIDYRSRRTRQRASDSYGGLWGGGGNEKGRGKRKPEIKKRQQSN